MQPVLKITSDNDTISLYVAGDIKDENTAEFQAWADQVHQTLLDLNQKTGKKVNFLSDVSRLNFLGEKIKEIYKQLLEKDMPYVRKSATFGASFSTLVSLTTLMIVSNRPNFRHFQTENEAKAWLKSEDLAS